MAFNKMMNPIGWAARPLCERLGQIESSIPITFLYGEVRLTCLSALYVLSTCDCRLHGWTRGLRLNW